MTLYTFYLTNDDAVQKRGVLTAFEDEYRLDTKYVWEGGSDKVTYVFPKSSVLYYTVKD